MSEATAPSEPTPAKSTAKMFVPLILAGLFMVTGICFLIFLGREKARIIGQTLADLDIQPLLVVDKPLTTEDMKGKVVVLHFWGFWCGPCKAEYPEIAALQKQYQGDPSVLIVSIACKNQESDTKDILAFHTEKFLNVTDIGVGPVYHDPAEYSRVQISQLLTAGGFTYPTTLVLDGSSRVVDVWRSPITKQQVEKAIEKARKATGG
jgi:cytochrome c biogenesis protein CcmG, thiol:disulfide interchange protein DsbE